jgi:hypothetical protein
LGLALKSCDDIKFLAEISADRGDFQGLPSVLDKFKGCFKQHALLRVQCIEVRGD